VTKLTKPEGKEGEAPSKMTERQTLKALVYPFEVLVSPIKAFKKITQNPNLIGLLLIGGLFLLAAATAEYGRASKIFLDTETQPVSLLNSDFFGRNLVSVLFQSAFSFLLNWIMYAGVLLLMIRVFREKGGPWRPFFIAVGYAFFILVIYVAINALLVLTLPEIHFQMSIWSSETPEDIAMINQTFNDVWGPTLAAQAVNYLSLVFQFWLVALGAIAVHASSEIKWEKAIVISVVAYFASVFLTAFLTSFLAYF